MLVKSTPVLISSTFYERLFQCESESQSFLQLRFSFVISGAKILYEKYHRLTLMKSTPGCFKVPQKRNLCKLRGKPIHGVNFTNIFTRSFYQRSSQKPKSQSSCQCLFTLLGPANVKAVHRTLMKLSHEVGFILIQLENGKKTLEKLNKHIEFLSSKSNMKYLKFFCSQKMR